MKHLIDHKIKETYLQHREDFAADEGAFDDMERLAIKEKLKNRKIISSNLGYTNSELATPAQDDLANTSAAYNQSYDRLQRSRTYLISDVVRGAEKEYLEAAVALIDKYNHLVVAQQLLSTVNGTHQINSMANVDALRIPGTASKIMGALAQPTRHGIQLYSHHQESMKREQLAIQLREEADI